MGFILPYATRLTIIISVLIVALRELCLHILDVLDLCREPSCNSSSSINGHTDFMPVSDSDAFQYPHLTVDSNDSVAMALNLKASLASFIYEDAEECAQEVNLRCAGKRQDLTAGGAIECSVCLFELERGQLVHITPNCCHVFHSDCIYKWLDHDQRTCPLCRTSLVALLHASGTAIAD